MPTQEEMEATEVRPQASEPVLERPRYEPVSDRMAPLRAQRFLALIATRFAPALTAGLIAGERTGHAGEGVAVGLAMLVAAVSLDPGRLPIHLMPLASFTIRALVPLVGAALVLIASALGLPISGEALLAATLGAAAIAAISSYVLLRVAPELQARVAVIGDGPSALALAAEFAGQRISNYEVCGWVDVSNWYSSAPVEDPTRGVTLEEVRSRLGPISHLRRIVLEQRVDLLVNAASEGRHGGATPGEVLETVAEECLDLPVGLIGINQLYEELFGHVPLATTDAAWFGYVLHPRFRASSPTSKRILDLGLGALAVLVAAPLVALAALAIKLDDRGPVLFRQRRVGERGHPFTIVKLRTMSVEAEAGGARWSKTDDPRVTRIGRLLRKTHVDELPQLWNVLRGEMSLVGPRPERPEFVAELERRIPFYDRRELIKPGITGWAQVRVGYAGSDEGTVWKLCHDLYYFKRRSLGLDLLILVETVVTALPVAGKMQFELRGPHPRFVLDAVRA